MLRVLEDLYSYSKADFRVLSAQHVLDWHLLEQGLLYDCCVQSPANVEAVKSHGSIWSCRKHGHCTVLEALVTADA